MLFLKLTRRMQLAYSRLKKINCYLQIFDSNCVLYVLNRLVSHDYAFYTGPNVFNGLLQCTKEKSHVIKRYLGNKRQNAVLPLSDFLYRSNRHQFLDDLAILAIFKTKTLRS